MLIHVGFFPIVTEELENIRSERFTVVLSSVILHRLTEEFHTKFTHQAHHVDFRLSMHLRRISVPSFTIPKDEGFINVHFYFQILLTSIISFQSNFRVTSVSSFQVTLCLWVILKSHLCRPCTDWWTIFRLIQLFFYPSHILN